MAKTGFPDMEKHWAEQSVNVLRDNGIIAGRGDGLFHPNELVYANEYVKMVVTALGYTDIENYPGDWARNYIDKAVDLGLILNGEIKSYEEPINRGMMAKIAMRALQDEATPDYIMAYKGLITDYEDLDANIRMDALKCVEKGIIKGMPDGAFRPSYFSTRAEAATVIHRMISEEEREKAKPIFADPDLEFEAFMKSDEAEKYCSVEFISEVTDGKIIFDGAYQISKGPQLIPCYHNEESNKETYEIFRNLVNLARENDRFVRIHLSSDNKAVLILYYEDSKYARGPNFMKTDNINFVINTEPWKYSIETNELSYYTIRIKNLAIQETDWAAVKYREPDMTEALELGLKSIYGEDLGLKLFNFAIDLYDKERDQWFNHDNRFYKISFIEYREDLNGLEIYYNNGQISTNK